MCLPEAAPEVQRDRVHICIQDHVPADQFGYGSVIVLLMVVCVAIIATFYIKILGANAMERIRGGVMDKNQISSRPCCLLSYRCI